MQLYKKVPSKYGGFCIAAYCQLLLALTMVWMSGGMAAAAGEPRTVAEIALYQGPDREKILIEGAKKEGQLILYHTHVHFKIVAQEFEKKYPFIKVSEWRSGEKELFPRVIQEYTAGRYLVDAVDMTDLIVFLQREGIMQEYYSPHLAYYGDEYKSKGKTGVYFMGELAEYIGLGFNTERVSRAEAPKSLKDLLDPKWKGRMSVTSSTTSITWLGNALETMGRDFIEKLSHQDIKVQNMSGGSLLNMIGSGEVALSPTIFDDTVVVARQKGAPVEWLPQEPAVSFVHNLGITTKSPHPHATMLFLDFVHSREGQQVMMKAGISSPRKDMGSQEVKFKKTIFRTKYTPEEYDKKYTEWENILRKFIGKAK